MNVYGNNTVAGVGYRKVKDELFEQKNTDVEDNVYNLVDDVQINIVTHDNKMLVEYAERSGLVEGLSKNQDIACKRLIYLMLQEIGQKKKVVFSSETAFPIRVEQLENFEAIRSDMKDFVTLYNASYSCEIIGPVTGNMFRFVNGLGTITDKQELQNYCSEFTKDDKGNNKQNK